jgi:hypothetical protein
LIFKTAIPGLRVTEAFTDFITNNASGTGPGVAYILKYANGGFYIANAETASSAHIAFNVGSGRRRVPTLGGFAYPKQ